LNHEGPEEHEEKPDKSISRFLRVLRDSPYLFVAEILVLDFCIAADRSRDGFAQLQPVV